LPVEITIIGSSGVGVFEKDQDVLQAFKAIDELAAKTRPVVCSFRSVESFLGTRFFYYAPQEVQPFVDIQRSIVATGLKFTRSPFPFTPHCTIVGLAENATEEATSVVASLPVPKEEIFLDTLSVYSLNGMACRLLHRVGLGGSR